MVWWFWFKDYGGWIPGNRNLVNRYDWIRKNIFHILNLNLLLFFSVGNWSDGLTMSHGDYAIMLCVFYMYGAGVQSIRAY